MTDIVDNNYTSCEQAVAAAVALSGTTSGCRYTFRPCCGTDTLNHYDEFSTQGVAIFGSHIITSSLYNLVDTNGYASGVSICSSKDDYDNTVSIDNNELSNFDIYEIDEQCGEGRCSRCASTVTPCDDSNVKITWVYTPQSGYDYSIGNVFSGSNINGYTTTTSYTLGISCVKIVTPSLPTEGTMYTVTDVAGSGYGTHIPMLAQACGCRSGVRVKNGYADGATMGGTSVTYSWSPCGQSSTTTYTLFAGNGVSTFYDIPGCIDFDSLTWSPVSSLSGIINDGDCCNAPT